MESHSIYQTKLDGGTDQDKLSVKNPVELYIPGLGIVERVHLGQTTPNAEELLQLQ